MLLRKPALCLLVALAAPVLAPIAAHADGPPQPVPADGQCAVPADPDWTKQEQFVWRNVCAGKVADFNREPGYGGNLDPKGAAGLPDSRILRSSFLETILLKDKYRNALTRLGVRIVGARFTESVDLRNAELVHDLWLDQSLLEKGAYLELAQTKAQISFTGSKIIDALSASGIEIGGNLFLDHAEIDGDMLLLRAHIVAVLDMGGTTVTGTLLLNGIRVDQNLFLRDKAQLKDVNLGGAHIGINLELDGGTIAGRLYMNAIAVDHNLYLRDHARFEDIDLTGAHIGGELDLSSSTVAGTLDMNGIRIDQSLFMRDKAGFGVVNLPRAHIGGEIDLTGSTVAGALTMYSARIDGDFLATNQAQFQQINLLWAHIAGSVDLNSATVAGTLAADLIDIGQIMNLDSTRFSDEVDLRAAKIGQELVLSHGIFDKDVKLNIAHIGGALWLDSVQWSKGATLDLTNTTVGTIDLSQGWPDTIYANGFSYRGLSNLSKYNNQQAEAWLGKQAYASQPYEQLAGVLQANGLTDEATEIRYAGRERERREATGLNWVWLVLLNYSIGFGYHLEYAFAWALGFVLLGWAVLYATGQRTKHGMTLGLAYSFDMLLPLVQLNKKHDDVDLDPWPQRYFYAHKLIGVLLTSFIVAGISGLTK